MSRLTVVGVVVGLVVLFLVLFPLLSRRRRAADHRLVSLGSVSPQWLLSHRHEDL